MEKSAEPAELLRLKASLKEALAKHGVGQDSSHDVHHCERVWRNAQIIAAAEKEGNLKILLAASFLHDLVNIPKNDPDRAQASVRSAKAAGPILKGLGNTDADIETTQEAIRAHSFSAEIPATSPEARILQDADRLEALGAIGIARAFHVSAHMGSAIMESEDPFAQNRPLDDKTYAIDHYAVKLLRLADRMQTRTGAEMARERTQTMLRFLSDLANETGHQLPQSWVPE